MELPTADRCWGWGGRRGAAAVGAAAGAGRSGPMRYVGSDMPRERAWGVLRTRGYGWSGCAYKLQNNFLFLLWHNIPCPSFDLPATRAPRLGHARIPHPPSAV